MVCAYMRHPADPGFNAIRSRAADLGTRLEFVDDHGPLDWGVVRQFDQLCAELTPDTWHAHDYKSNLIGLFLARKYGFRLVTTVHGWVERSWKLPVYYAVDRFTLPRYQRVICVSEDLAQTCLSLGVRSERCSYIANAIDLDDYQRNESIHTAKSRALGKRDLRDKFVVGAAGRLSAEKGFDNLIRAFAELTNRDSAHLWIAGDGNQRDILQRLITDLGIGTSVTLLGFAEDLKPLFQATDLFALSSLREGIPNVLLEAMAMEIPVVSTRIAGVPALIADGETGQLVEPGSVSELSQAIAVLRNDEHRRTRFARAARKHLETKFDFARRMDRVGDLYDALPWTEQA